VTFIGATLTLQLLQQAWPEASLGGLSSEPRERSDRKPATPARIEKRLAQFLANRERRRSFTRLGCSRRCFEGEKPLRKAAQRGGGRTHQTAK